MDTISKKRLSRKEKAEKAVTEYRDELVSQNLDEEEFEKKLSSFVGEIKNRYRKLKKGKQQKIDEYRYEMLDKFQNDTSTKCLSQDELNTRVDLLVEEKKKELNSKKRIKKKKKSKSKKIDSRRIQFIINIKEEFPDASEKEINNRLEEYKKYESDLLEDDITYNKKLIIVRKELESKHGTDEESLHKIRDFIITKMVEEKEKFLTGKSNDDNDTDYQTQEEKKRIMNMKDSGNSDRLGNFTEMIDNISSEVSSEVLSEVSSEVSSKSDISNNTKQDKNNRTLMTEDSSILLKKYKQELIKKFSNRKFLIQERYKIIDFEMKIEAGKIKKEVSIERKLINERKDLEKAWNKRKKYKKNPSKLAQDLARHMNKRIKMLEEYKEMGIDPDEHDKVSVNMANKIWSEVHEKANADLKKWNETPAKQKLDPFVEKYKEFGTGYPIILKYMIFKFQYDVDAFKRFLEKCRQNLPSKTAKHDEVEDMRFQNQSYYVQYLFEEHEKKNGRHIDQRVAKKVFNETYEQLRKEKEEFTQDFEDTKEQLDIETTSNIKESLADLAMLIQQDLDLKSLNDSKKSDHQQTIDNKQILESSAEVVNFTNIDESVLDDALDILNTAIEFSKK